AHHTSAEPLAKRPRRPRAERPFVFYNRGGEPSRRGEKIMKRSHQSGRAGQSGVDRRAFMRASAAAGAAVAFGGLPLASLGQDRRLASIGGIAKTRAGRVRGLLRDGVHQFWCVPYGAPTGGANRFMPPQPPTPWSGVRDHFELTFARSEE